MGKFSARKNFKRVAKLLSSAELINAARVVQSTGSRNLPFIFPDDACQNPKSCAIFQASLSANMSIPINVLLRYSLGLLVAAYVLRQARKPDKIIGRLLLHAMNESHLAMTEWGFTHIAIENNYTILDVGCGGGRTVHRLATIANGGIVCGIDYADGSVTASQRENAALIKAGRVSIQKASVSHLPFPENHFDLITAIETQYYWPDLNPDMREILRVLKPGGKLIVIAETYKGGKFDTLKWPLMWLLRSSHLSVDNHRQLFSTTGYTDVQIFEEHHKGWICAIGAKPS